MHMCYMYSPSTYELLPLKEHEMRLCAITIIESKIRDIKSESSIRISYQIGLLTISYSFQILQTR